ncbi:hypothetical protein C8R43DRAFT_1047893 [Mycena crocata]|nr:hypothetical protein C8R43DRAFT_1047893 [Mycena crocata]
METWMLSLLLSIPKHRTAATPLPPPMPLSVHTQVQETLQHAWSASTLDKYDNGLAHFHAFCDKHDVSHPFRLPASEFLLCAFASSHARTHASGTVGNKLSGVRAWHITNDVRWYGSLRLSYVLKGIDNLAPDALPPRPPITLDMLWFLYDNLDFSDPFDVAVFACAVVAFWCQCRLGEILSTTERLFDPKLIPTVSDLKPPCTSAGSRLLHLPNTKVKRRKGEDTFMSKQRGFADPLSAVDKHLAMNALAGNDPLFAYRTRNGGILALTKRKFMARCNSIWGRFGLPLSTGHCFRIGGTTELLLAGVPPDVVRILGRWSSDAFLRYWRSLERIAPLHVELLTL